MAQNIDIQKKTDSLNKEITNLKENKSKYKNMSKKLEQALKELKVSKKFLNTAYTELRKNYSSESRPVTRKKEQIQFQIDAIDKLIKKINETLLPECNRQINSMNSKLTSKNDEIEKLNKK